MDIEPPELQPSRSPVKRSSATFLYGQLTNRIIGCAIEVHKELGPGFLEALYEEAFCAELSRQNLAFVRQRPVHVSYKGLAIGTHRLDVVVEQKVIVELKAVKAIDEVHLAVMISYLKASRYPLGLIVNFSAAITQIRRLSRELTQQQGGRETGEKESES
jgi:GxxExxY protein